MEQQERFGWIGFYSELADKLTFYRNRRPELIAVVKDVYAKTGIRLPKLDGGELADIDPFSVFGLFNKGIKNENRTKSLQGCPICLVMDKCRRVLKAQRKGAK